MDFGVLPALYPEFRAPIYDFSRLPDDREIFKRLVSYDNRLFLLWSLMHERWELWRWKQEVSPRPPSSEREILEMARCQCTFPVGYIPDQRLINNLPVADTWRVVETNDPDCVSEEIEREVDEEAARDRQEISNQVHDLVEDNATQLQREMREEIRGYYPPDDNR